MLAGLGLNLARTRVAGSHTRGNGSLVGELGQILLNHWYRSYICVAKAAIFRSLAALMALRVVRHSPRRLLGDCARS